MRSVCILFVLSFSLTVIAQNSVPFESFKSEVRTAWGNGDYDKSIELLQKNRGLYVEDAEQHTLIYYLGLLYLEVDEHQKSFEIFNEGFKKQFFFSFWPAHHSKIRQHADGEEIIQQNTANKAIFQKESKISYEVMLPEGYDSELTYPLLYFLHGNNSNLEYLKSNWENISLSIDFIVVLVQSPYPRSNYTFDWIDSTSDRGIIRNMHLEILRNYSIDSTKVILSGFSNGGRKAIDLFNDQTISSIGFIAFNPSKPKTAINQDLHGRGAIITGEKDYLLAKQMIMINAFFSQSFPLRLVVLPNHGHDYPKHFEDELNNSIEFLFDKNE